jgi:uncharacterized protein (TIGR02246 family)
MTDYDNWIKELFQAIDQMDADKFSEFFVDEARFIFGNSDAVIGREAIREYVAGFFAAIAGIKHRIDTIIAEGENLVCRGEVTYIRKDSTTLTAPFAYYFKLTGDKAAHYQIYGDTSQLFRQF